ncbi:nose resistant to fluoxetine protein 6-like [Amphibalanus amphitrite]|uniref:nose resistant to fluoxetine protein 6-like n=1 Tax=Amphibalanus amphitrite TaxID=1232801 RepID=UPI001C90E08C|nr:nose resistant to fluoxetine protein 6-like [Amphibalanus amphitrite]
MVARWIVLLAVALTSGSAEQGPRQQLLQRLPDLSWSRLSALERLVETSGHLSTEELLRRTGTLELYQALPEADGQLDRLNLLIGLLIGPYITPLAAFREISPLCRQHSWQYVTNILGINNTWALMMFDSVGKLPDGIFAGNTNPVGIWDECLNVEAVIDGIREEDHMFKGKYCRPEFGLLTNASEDGQVQHSLAELHNWSSYPSGLGIEPILPPLIHVSGHTVLSQLIVSVGLCIPSSCSADELRLGLEKRMPGVAVTLPDGNCHVLDQETTFTGGDIAVMTILCVVGLLMIVGTFIDVVKESAAEDGATVSVVVDSKFRARMPSTLQKVFLAFSVWTNGRKLLDTSSSSDTLGCLHGIRFLSMTWVILGHQYVFGLGTVPWANVFYIFDVFNSLAFAAVDNATVSVDSFFFLSGLLVAYIFMRNMERSKGKFNIIMYYVHRYIRLTPVLAMVIAFVSTLYRHIGNGPFWSNIAENGSPEVCSEYWWRNLLYVNNLFDPQELCLGQTWYLANDMQMFIASPIVLLPLFFYPILGQIWLMFLIALNVFVTGYVTAYNDLGPQDNGNNATKLRYFMPYCRYGAYLVGVYTGYFLHVRRRRPLKLSLPAVLAGWTVSALTACCIVYGMYEYTTVPALAVPSRSVAIIYGSMNRPVWAMCLAWVVIACVHGYGGFINTLLSWKFWIPLSRVTYCCYLVSIDTQVFFYATLKSVLYFDQTNAVYQFLATLCIAVAVATVFSLAFESPMLALEKIIFANVGTGAPKKKPVEPEPVASKPELQTELADGSPQEEVENNSS